MSVEHNFKWKNNGRTKVMIGCGTRPEIIRLAAVIKRCREYFDTCVVYYNQNWDRNLSTVFWEDFELRNELGEFGPDILVPVVGENLGVTCGNILGRSYELAELNFSRMDIWYLVIRTPAFLPSLLRDYTSRSSTWKLETVVRTSVCRKRLIGVLWM